MQAKQHWQPLKGFVDFSTDPYEFDLDEYLAKAVPDPEMLKHPETRRALTRANPILFALLYLPHHLRDAQGEIHFSRFHLSLYKWAAGFWHQKPSLYNARDVFIAPRGAAKSTMTMLLLPMWASCNKLISFGAAYSDSESTVTNHLNTFRSELKQNELIYSDFPWMRLGKAAAEEHMAETGNEAEMKDTALMIKTVGGFIFAVKSISSNSLGLKIGARRPDAIFLDDCERQGGDYSPMQAEKRRMAIVGGILGQSKPLGARVVMIGTNLMIGSIMDGMIRKVKGEEYPEWIDEEEFKVHWFKPFITRADGNKQSMWPGVWETQDLLAREHTESFAVDMLNEPMAKGGSFWEREDFSYGSIDTRDVSFGVLSIDPATTSTRDSDYTALAVVLYSRLKRRYEVVYSHQQKLTPKQIKLKVEDLISMYPEITSVLIETNQGGDTWMEILAGVPVKVNQVKATVSKEMRASRTLNVYQTIAQDGLPRVLHRMRFPDLERQMCAFPAVGHDDLVDSVTTAVFEIEQMVATQRAKGGRRPMVQSVGNYRKR